MISGYDDLGIVDLVDTFSDGLAGYGLSLSPEEEYAGGAAWEIRLDDLWRQDQAEIRQLREEKREGLVADVVQAQLRRASDRGNVADLTLRQWLAIVRSYCSQCAYCGSQEKRPVMDHVVPISRGGGTTASNVVPACAPCNSRKHAFTLEELEVRQPLMFRGFMASRVVASEAA